MATTPVKPKTPAETPVKETSKTEKVLVSKPETIAQDALLNKDIDHSFITEEEKVKLINAYPVLIRNDFDRKDGEYTKDVFVRVATKIGMTAKQLSDYLRDK